MTKENAKLLDPQMRMAFALSRAEIVQDGLRAILRLSKYDLGQSLSDNTASFSDSRRCQILTNFVYESLTPPPENLYLELLVEPQKTIWAVRVQDMDLAQEIKNAALRICEQSGYRIDAPAKDFANAAALKVVEGKIAVLRQQLAEVEASAHQEALKLSAEFRRFAIGVISRGQIEAACGKNGACISIRRKDVNSAPPELAEYPELLVASFAVVAEQAGLDPETVKVSSTQTIFGQSLYLEVKDNEAAQRLRDYCRAQQP